MSATRLGARRALFSHPRKGKRSIYVQHAQRPAEYARLARSHAIPTMSNSNCTFFSVQCNHLTHYAPRFPKRNFRCDCPTTGIAHKCTLDASTYPENTSNTYNHNFQGLFCRCRRTYDAQTEREAMIQCLACEVRLPFDLFRGMTELGSAGLVPRIVL